MLNHVFNGLNHLRQRAPLPPILLASSRLPPRTQTLLPHSVNRPHIETFQNAHKKPQKPTPALPINLRLHLRAQRISTARSTPSIHPVTSSLDMKAFPINPLNLNRCSKLIVSAVDKWIDVKHQRGFNPWSFDEITTTRLM